MTLNPNTEAEKATAQGAGHTKDRLTKTCNRERKAHIMITNYSTKTPICAQPSIEHIRAWIRSADEKLEMAYDAAKPGEPIHTLLDHINHDVIIDPQHLIERKDLTKADARGAYDGLFPVLACVQGAIKLAENTVLNSTLNEAFQLLDAAQNGLDPVSDAVRSLPLGTAESEVTTPISLPAEASFEALGIGDGAYNMLDEAIAIIRSRAQDLNSELLYGAKYCAEHARDILRAGIDASDVQACENASAPLAVAISVLEAVVNDNLDAALHGALRLLGFAKTALDDAIAEAA